MIGSRLKALRKALGLTQEKFGREIGKSRIAIAQYESGKRKIDESTIKLISLLYHVNENWLKEGKGEMFREPVQEQENSLIKIPFFSDVQLSAGYGTEAGLEEKKYVYFSIDMMLELFGTVYRNGLILLTVTGNSMFPALKDGDIAVIRLYEYENHIRDGAIYAFRIDDDLYVKRVFKNPKNKSITFKSDNEEYPSFTLEEEELERVKFIGRVIGHLGRN